MKPSPPWELYEQAVGWAKRHVRDEDDARTLVLDVFSTIDVSPARDLKAFVRTAVERDAIDFNRRRTIDVADYPVPDRAGGENPEDVASARQQAAAIDSAFPSLFIESERDRLNVNDRKRLSRMRATIRKMLDD